MNASRGRIGGYALWQLRDYVTTVAGAGSLLIPFMTGVFPLLIMTYMSEGVGANPGQITAAANSAFDTLVATTATLGALLSVAGLVSSDRHPGLARFLFSKPVGVPRYYLQAWLVRGAALAFIMLILAQTVHQVVATVPWLAALGAVAIAWVLLGGVGLLFSVLTSRDGWALVGVYLIVNVFDAMHKAAPEAQWPGPVLAILPPMHKLEGIRHSLLRHTPVDQGDLWHVLLFGAACVALAMYLVRRMALVR